MTMPNDKAHIQATSQPVGPREYQPVLTSADQASPVNAADSGDELALSPKPRTRTVRKPGLEVIELARHSPLFAYLRPGDYLVSINEEPVADTIDFHFKMAEDEVDMLFEKANGEQLLFEFAGVTLAELGLTFDPGVIRTCNNGCIFCFVMQQPKGMRRSLYIMDEDYRYSFTHGNFVTLSNTTDADIARIIEQRLSPLYISVHTTNDTLRRCMLKNELLDPIVPRIKELTAAGIEIHTQVVLCPGINDGPELERTIRELMALYPGVQTLALAPVGLTKYRDNLPDLPIYGATAAGDVIKMVTKIQKRALKEIGTRFVWPADEFYTIAGMDFPPLSHYEGANQFENGVGMCRSLIAGFNRKKRYLKEKMKSAPHRNARLIGLTGQSAYPWLEKQVAEQARELGLDVTFKPVQNKFWGGTVTISGLLTGKDLMDAALEMTTESDTVLLPPNCLNNDDLFLDNKTLEDFKAKLGRRVVVGSYDMVDTLIEAIYPEDETAHAHGDRIVALTEAI